MAAAMLSFLRGHLRDSLAGWAGSEEEKLAAAERLIGEIFRKDDREEEGGPKEKKARVEEREAAERRTRKEQHDKCIGVAQTLRSVQGKLEDLGAASVATLYQSHVVNRHQNMQIFASITDHHRSLAERVDEAQGRSWTEAVQADPLALRDYAQAATAMGEKAWVRLGHAWMMATVRDFFQGGGARRVYLKHLRATHFRQHGALMSADHEARLAEGLDTDILAGQSVRLLDVGSCYNPFQHEAAFAVTALDLEPTCESVYCCDFLTMDVGPPGSAAVAVLKPLQQEQEQQQKHKGQGVAAAEGLPRSQHRLTCLPADTFDVVTISLVLSYLPTPQHRRDMLIKARALLQPPPLTSSSGPASACPPHRASLLLVMEKESVLHSGPRTEHFLRHWKTACAALGLDLLSYKLLQSDRKKAHAFAFVRAPDEDASETASDGPTSVLPGGLVTKTDIDAIEAQRGSRLSDEELVGILKV